MLMYRQRNSQKAKTKASASNGWLPNGWQLTTIRHQLTIAMVNYQKDFVNYQDYGLLPDFSALRFSNLCSLHAYVVSFSKFGF